MNCFDTYTCVYTMYMRQTYRPSSNIINKIDEIIFLFNEMIVVGNEYQTNMTEIWTLKTIAINANGKLQTVNMWNEMWQWKDYDG